MDLEGRTRRHSADRLRRSGPPRVSHPSSYPRSVYYEREPVRIGGRLKNALMADLVVDADLDEGDRLLLKGVGNSEHDWTDHLGRQLGLETRYYREAGIAGIHDTLMVLIPELDRMLQQWPPATDNGACSVLARAATQGLSDLEVYATLLAGSTAWRHSTVGADCRVENLASHLRTTIERALAADLSQMLQRWVAWDVLRLRDRGQHAKLQADTAEAERKVKQRERARHAAEAAPKRTRIPPPPDISSAKRLAGYYQPPGRA